MWSRLAFWTTWLLGLNWPHLYWSLDEANALYIETEASSRANARLEYLEFTCDLKSDLCLYKIALWFSWCRWFTRTTQAEAQEKVHVNRGDGRTNASIRKRNFCPSSRACVVTRASEHGPTTEAQGQAQWKRKSLVISGQTNKCIQPDSLRRNTAPAYILVLMLISLVWTSLCLFLCLCLCLHRTCDNSL